MGKMTFGANRENGLEFKGKDGLIEKGKGRVTARFVRVCVNFLVCFCV